MNFSPDSVSPIARSMHKHSWSMLNGILVVILIIILMQNPFGIAYIVFGDRYQWIYLTAIWCFLLLPFVWTRYKIIIYYKKYLQYYGAFVLLSLACIMLNSAARLEIELLPTVRFIARLIQFYVVYNILRIVGVSFILRWMYRAATVFSFLHVAYSLLNLLEMSNPFFNILLISDVFSFYYAFPFGFSNYLIPHYGTLHMFSYFTEASSFCYFLIICLIYAGYTFNTTRKVRYVISIVLFLTSIAFAQSVAGYATLAILVPFVIIRNKIRKISITNIFFMLVFLILFIWAGFLIITFLLSGEIENTFMVHRALSIELRSQEWMWSFREILMNPLGFGIGNVSIHEDVLQSNIVSGFGQSYGGPTNFLAPIYSLGLPYLIPFMFYGAVLFWCLRIKYGASSDLRMVSVMVIGGMVVSASYYQLNTAVFHVTLAAFFILLSEEGRGKVIAPNPGGENSHVGE